MKLIALLVMAGALVTGGVYASQLVGNTIECKRAQGDGNTRMNVRLAGCLDFEQAAIETQAVGEALMKQAKQELAQWMR